MPSARVTLRNLLFAAPLRPALLAVIAVPLTTGTGWREARYKHIPPNRVSYSEAGLKIEVRESSSPLFYTLPAVTRITGVSFEGAVTGLPALPAGAEEGGPRADDYAFRLGLVLEGEHGVGWLEKLFAPEWLRQLVDLAPDDAKFEKVAFLTLSQQKAPGTKRLHPKTKYVEEEVAARLEAPGPFAVDHALPEMPRAFGLWLHADGDDTHSSFDVTLKSLRLATDGEPKEVGTKDAAK